MEEKTRTPPLDRDPTAPSTIAGAGQVVGWGLALWGGVQVASAVLDRKPLGSSLLQAVMAEWGAGRLGIAWSDPLAPIAEWTGIARRASRGAALGAAAAILVVASALATRGASIASAASLGSSIGLLGVGLCTAVLAAVRDELLLRGVVLRATRGLLPAWACLLACGAAAAAARFGVDGAAPLALTAEALRGVALASLWVRDRGAWMAFAANASWMWTLGSLAHGGLLDVRFVVEPDDAATAVAILTGFAIAGWMSIPRRQQ
jgi:hypothetical protein